MSQKTDEQKNTDFQEELKKIWKWLRAYPPYKKDYYAQRKKCLSKDKAFKRWKFYPLINPQSNEISFELWDYIYEITDAYAAPEAIYLRAVAAKDSPFFSESTEDCYNPTPEIAKRFSLPNKTLVVDVYPYKDADVLAAEFKKKVKKWQEENAVHPKRLTVGNLLLKYQAIVMRGLGYNSERIRREIKTSLPGASNPGAREATRLTASRILKKAANHS